MWCHVFFYPTISTSSEMLNKSCSFFYLCCVLYHLTEKGKTRHLKLGAPPTSAYSWPQMKTAGKCNPHQCRLAALWMHRGAQVWWQRAANERRALLFSSPVNRRLPACRLLSVHLLALRDLRHTRSLRSLTPLNNAGRIKHLSVSLSLCLSLSLSFPDTNHNCSCQNSPAGFRFT